MIEKSPLVAGKEDLPRNPITSILRDRKHIVDKDVKSYGDLTQHLYSQPKKWEIKTLYKINGSN